MSAFRCDSKGSSKYVYLDIITVQQQRDMFSLNFIQYCYMINSVSMKNIHNF